MPKDGKNAEACPQCQQTGLAEGLGILRRLPRDPPLHVAVAATVPEHPADASEPPSAPPPRTLPADLDATALDACYEEEEQGAVGEGQHYITRHWVEALYMGEQDPLCVGLVRMKETGLALRAPRVRTLELWSVDAARAQIDCTPSPCASEAACEARALAACLTLGKEGTSYPAFGVTYETVLLLRGGTYAGRLLRPRRHRRAGGGDDARGSQTPSTVCPDHAVVLQVAAVAARDDGRRRRQRGRRRR